MTGIPPQPRVKLSLLRDIGWKLWDPIGLMGTDGRFPGNWDDKANSSFADEYDEYLISAAAQLRHGASSHQVVDYLVNIEREHMALGERSDIRDRAEAVVSAILAEKGLWVWPNDRGRFD